MSFARARALAIIGVLVVCAIVAVTVTLVKDRQRSGPAAADCQGLVVADLRLPEPKDVKINVFNTTPTPNLAGSVAADFRNRKFQVLKHESVQHPVKGVALLRYGPKTVGAAWLLRAYFLNEADREFDIKRTDNVVDVLIGESFKQLATVTEFHQALAQLGKPTLPDGTCALDENQ